jgi:hypothetical protein
VHDWVQLDCARRKLIPPRTFNDNSPRSWSRLPTSSLQWSNDDEVFVREQFGRDVPLFNQTCFGHDQPIFDLHEMMPNWETDPERARAYV